MRDWQKITAVTLWSAAALGMAGAAVAETGMMGGKGGMDMAAMFAELDADKDGKVTQAEMDAHRAARVAGIDANADGLISADELAQMQIKALTDRITERAAKMVERLDSDKDGLLSAAEMAAGPGQGMLIDRLDTDGDGAISLAEMEAAQAKMGERGKGHGRGHGHGGPDGGFWGMFGDEAAE